MKNFLSVFLFSLIFLSTTVFAACEKDGNTVVYVNGILTSKRDAQDDTYFFKTKFEEKTGRTDVIFLNGYNQSHFGGVGDLAETASQIFNNPISNYDRDTILLEIYPDVTTRKILLVGHSQGTLYANEIYDYLTTHGESEKAVGVYNIATPESFVAGSGTYLTSENDKVINAVRNVASKVGAKQPLPANITIPLTAKEAADKFGGHSFSGVYLANDSARIVSEVESQLKKLVATEVPNTANDGCFTPPAKGLTYYAQKSVFAVADTAATGVVAANGTIAAVGEIAYNSAFTVAQSAVTAAETGIKNTFAVVQNGAGIVGNFFSKFSREAPDTNGLALVAEIPLGNHGGSEGGRNDASDKSRATNKTNSPNRIDEINQSVVLVDTQDEGAAEQAALVAAAKKSESLAVSIVAPSPASQPAVIVSSSGQGEAAVQQCKYIAGGTPMHQKLLINEVAWMGSLVSANDEWIELKNISGQELDISNWQILDRNEQIKIIFSNGKKVPVGGFLLLERTDDNSLPGIAADLIYSGALSNTNEGLQLFDKNCVLVDEVTASPDWPAGDSTARKTMERSSDLSWHTYSGTGENFGGVLIMGTPKKENSPAVVPGGSSNNNSNVSVPPVAQNILISEIQTTGGTGHADNEFIELYNPNGSAIDLSVLPLNLHIRNSAGTDSHKPLTFINKIMPARGYFLIGPASGYAGPAALDATYSTSSGNKLVNNGGVYISKSLTADLDILDKVGWGTQPAGGYETAAFPENPIANQSISRQSANDTGNNSSDFIKSKPTPKNSSNSGGFLNPETWVVSQQLVNHIVISEIYPDRTGANLDFVELYNPNATSTADLDIAGWSLQVLSASATSTDKITKKNFVTGNKISGRRFFLIGIDNYPGGDMAWASGSLNSTDGATIFLVSGTTTISNIKDPRIVDRVAYGGGSAADFAEGIAVAMPAAGQSLERMAFRNDLCISSQNNGEFLGNGCDTDDNAADFELRTVPNPQTAQRFPEPRTTPSLPRNLTTTYDSASALVRLAWDASQDYKGATSTLNYLISYATSTAALKDLAAVSATTTYSFKANEVGINYTFSVLAKDSEGLSSLAAITSVAVSSPLSHFYFYKDTRSTTSKKYLFDFYYDSYPFMPDVYSNGSTGKILVFYLNKIAPTELELNTANDFLPGNLSEALGVAYPICSGGNSQRFSLILPGPCGNGGGAENSTLNSATLEDTHLLIELATTTDNVIFTYKDFVTVGMYSFYESSSGNQRFKLSALDRNKYYFQNTSPSHQAPTKPANLELSYNATTSLLRIVWDKSTDSDTLDNLITYEINYSTNTFLSDGSWISAPIINLDSSEAAEVGSRGYTKISVEPGITYNIALRAKDDFGDLSFSATSSYAVPDITPPYGISNIKWGYLSSTSTAEISFNANPYPFMSSGMPTAIMFFLNQNPPANYSFSNDEYDWTMSGTNKVLRLGYDSCGHANNYAIFSGLIFNNSFCLSGDSGLKNYSARKDLNFGQTIFTARVTGIYNSGNTDPYSFSGNDFVTLGFYQLFGNIFRQVAAYTKKIYFQ